MCDKMQIWGNLRDSISGSLAHQAELTSLHPLWWSPEHRNRNISYALSDVVSQNICANVSFMIRITKTNNDSNLSSLIRYKIYKISFNL